MAVLVAISIPIFTTQLEKSRESTDLANVRAAYAEQVAALLEWDGTAANKPGDINVPSKQTQENWQSQNDAATATIAEGHEGQGISVPFKTGGNNYVVKVNDAGTAVTVE